MPLRGSPLEPALLAAARHALARLWSRGPRGPLPVREHRLEQLHLVAPHPVFDLSLDDVAQGRGLESARLSGLRFVVLAGERAIAAVELVRGNGPLPVPHVQLGPLAEALATALRQTEDLEPVRAKDHELRLLRISGLYLLAVWAHGEQDLLVPLAPAPPGVLAGEAQAPAALLDALRERARTRAAFRFHP